jgi:signal transduction histidine kinase
MSPLASPQVYAENLSAAGTLSVHAADMALYGLFIGLILAILWLSNRHIKKSHSYINDSNKRIESERISFERRLSERTSALVHAEEQRLIELQRNAEFGKLSQGLFHDLISPLSAVSLYAKELGAQATYSKKTQDAIRVVTESSRRMNSFMEAVRRSLGSTESDANALETASADLEKEISIIKDILGFKARMAGVSIIVHQDEKITLPIHPVRLHQLLLNLVSNGIDACKEADKLAHPADKNHSVTISALRNKDSVELSVSDTGCGISAENMARMFKQQFTTKAEGSGIGLLTIKTIVEHELKGTIEVESKEGVGTTFTIGMPIKLKREDNAKGFRQLEHNKESNTP